MEFLHVFFPLYFKRRCHFQSDLPINLSFDIFSTSFMDVISPTRFVNHPSFMDYDNYLNNPFVLIIPDKTNLEGKLLTSNTITLYLFSMNIITYSFASYLGHCSS